MSRMAEDKLVAVGHCPGCGYDQRGLPDSGRCPECGGAFVAGVAFEAENRWVERTCVNLWAIVVLQLVGVVCGVVGLLVSRETLAAGMMMLTASLVYLSVSFVWYVATCFLVWRRWSKPSFLNVTERRRKRLGRMVFWAGVLIGGTVVLAVGVLG